MNSWAVSLGELQLVGGTTPAGGRLEVWYSDDPVIPPSWRTVCLHEFSMVAADVACRQLGFLYADQYQTVGLFQCVKGGLGGREGGTILLFGHCVLLQLSSR